MNGESKVNNQIDVRIRQVYQIAYQVIKWYVRYRIHMDCRFVQTIRVTYF